MSHNGRKNADDQLAFQIAGGGSVRDSARQAGISERTAYRRLDNEQFRQRVNHFRDELFQSAIGGLADAATEAVTTLRSLLKSRSPMVRLGAARAILEHGPKLREAAEVHHRGNSADDHHKQILSSAAVSFEVGSSRLATDVHEHLGDR